jgi:hypothetical protein
LPWWESIDTITPAGRVVFAAFADDAKRAIMQSHNDEMAVLPAVI